eukprot:SAG11_NODE_6422_length_1317_cov_1.550903_1_plen_88_part_01
MVVLQVRLDTENYGSSLNWVLPKPALETADRNLDANAGTKEQQEQQEQGQQGQNAHKQEQHEQEHREQVQKPEELEQPPPASPAPRRQ